MMKTTWSKPTKYLIGIGLVILGIFLLYLSRPVIPLLIIAALIAVIVRPVILWLHRSSTCPAARRWDWFTCAWRFCPAGRDPHPPTIIDALAMLAALIIEAFSRVEPNGCAPC